MLLTRKTAILAKIESTYGTDSVPTGAANATVIRNAVLTPMDQTTIDRDIVRPYLGSSLQLVAMQKVILTFEVECAGAGTSATNTPAFDALLQGCGWAGVVNTTISFDYTPISGSFKSLSIYAFIDGIQHRLTGCMGDMELDFTVGQIPVIKFTFWGIYNSPADVANPSLTITGWQTPLAVNNANTTGFALQGFSTGLLQNLNIKMGNKLSYQTLVGSGGAGNPGEYVQIVDRDMVGTANMRLPDSIATKDWYTAAKNQTLGTLTLTQGTVAFNKFQLTAPSTSVQVTKPTLGDLDGARMIQLQLSLVPTAAGNDELKLSTL
jgi:hypothetical protein